MKRVRLIVAAGAIVWASALPFAAAAAAAASGAPAQVRDASALSSVGSWPSMLAALVYATGSVVCHQQAGRSFHWDGAAWPVCARCAGVYIAAALTMLGVGAASGSRRTIGSGASTRKTRVLVALALMPTILSVAWEWTSGAPTSNALRAAAGVPIGAAVAWIVMQSG